MKLRQHRGMLDESMATIVEIEPTISSLTAEIAKSLSPFGREIQPSQVHVEPYGCDDRINWDTHIVTVDGYGVYGFTDGPLSDSRVFQATPTMEGPTHIGYKYLAELFSIAGMKNITYLSESNGKDNVRYFTVSIPQYSPDQRVVAVHYWKVDLGFSNPIVSHGSGQYAEIVNDFNKRSQRERGNLDKIHQGFRITIADEIIRAKAKVFPDADPTNFIAWAAIDRPCGLTETLGAAPFLTFIIRRLSAFDADALKLIFKEVIQSSRP